MKLRVVIEVDVSATIAATMQRNGFTACQDGSSMQIKVPNAPSIPQRKTKVLFIENPTDDLFTIAGLNKTDEAATKLTK